MLDHCAIVHNSAEGKTFCFEILGEAWEALPGRHWISHSFLCLQVRFCAGGEKHLVALAALRAHFFKAIGATLPSLLQRAAHGSLVSRE
jgi:hypothetical protein